MKQEKNKDVKNKKEQILFVTKAKFPEKNAFAIFIGGIASIFNASNFDVFCIGSGDSKKGEVLESYFGNYVSLRNNRCKSVLSKIINQVLLENRIFNYLKNNFDCPKHIFFSCEFSLSFYKKVKKLFKEKSTKFSFILTEEYTKDEFEKFTLLSRKSLRINHYIIYDYVSNEDTFIVISKYLFNKMSERGLKCTYIPFCFNFTHMLQKIKSPTEHEGINYIYCGNPENKDLLPTIIQSFSSFCESFSENEVLLNVIGVDHEWLKKHNIDSFDSKHIKFHGKQNRGYVLEYYSRSDYSILLRDENKTFAKAGFPTKITESMVMGVTPIINLTSNLSDYLNNDNAIIVNGHVEPDLLTALQKSVNDIANNQNRRVNAFSTAKANFDIEHYKDKLLSLINKHE